MELNAEQVKKALECCASGYCFKDDCPLTEIDGDYSIDKCTSELAKKALSLINSQEQRIGAQDMTISELRQRAEKAEHDADRYAQRIKELTEESKKWEQAYDCMDSAIIAMIDEKTLRLEKRLAEGSEIG